MCVSQDNCGMKIGQIIRQIRLEKKITLEELAFEIGTDAANLSRIERNLQNPTQDALDKIAITLDLPLSSLFLMVEQNIEPYAVETADFKNAQKRLTQFVTRFMLLNQSNQGLVNEFLSSMLKSQEKPKD
jgi:transcriptional regulator with XRE-family HTH domain